MLRTILAGALASGALLAGGGAQAQGYGYGGYGVGVGAGVGFGYDGGAPAYAGAGYGYAPYRPHGFTLAGVRAGVTVLGVDIDGSAKLTIGAHDWNRGYAPPPAPYYPPAPPPQPYPEPVAYPQAAYAAPSYGYGYGCGCAPPPPPCCTYGGGY